MTKLEETFALHAHKVNQLMEECEKLMKVVGKETHDLTTVSAVADVLVKVVGVAHSRDRLRVEIYREENISDERETRADTLT